MAEEKNDKLHERLMRALDEVQAALEARNLTGTRKAKGGHAFQDVLRMGQKDLVAYLE